MPAPCCQRLAAASFALLATSCIENTGPAGEQLRWASISAGGFHTCASSADGIAYCWGSNNYAQLGGGPAVPLWSHFRPIAVADGLAFAGVSAGGLHTCALGPDGRAYCWGRNLYGQLGTGSAEGPTMCRTSPCAAAPTPVASELEFRAISAGRDHTCALSRGGEVYCWGANYAGQLGTNGPAASAAPTAPPHRRSAYEPVAASEAEPFTCALAEGGWSYCPMPMAVASDLRFVAVSTGDAHTCALTEDASVYCWGRSRFGQAGPLAQDTCFVNDIRYLCSTTPVAAAEGLAFQAIAAGGDHTCGSAIDGATYCWGDDGQAQLGVERESVVAECTASFVREPYPCSPDPVRVSGGLTFEAVAAGGAHTCGLVDGGAAYCWGGHMIGQRGDCSLREASSLPRAVCGGHRFTWLGAGSSHTCAITPDGTAYCWGRNDSGELGGGAFTALGPVKVEPPVGARPE